MLLKQESFAMITPLLNADGINMIVVKEIIAEIEKIKIIKEISMDNSGDG